MKKLLRSRVAYVALGLIVVLLVFSMLSRGSSPKSVSYSDLQTRIGQVASATIHDSSDIVTGKFKDGTSFSTSYPAGLDKQLTNQLAAVKGIDLSIAHGKTSFWATFFSAYLPLILFGGIILVALNAMQGGGSRVMSFGKAKAKTAGKDQPKVTFADVAGAEEAVAELQEIKEFLESPSRFQALGAKIPKGVLLFGPPGTGKTLLARAVAGEAGVPFFSISGSDFVEMFVGVGASRVRDLFEQAKSNAPAIVFMDEIDAVGRHRGAGLGGGHDEREQTLNQLLVEMDGFDVRGGVILIAATNRPDILDPALLRPGRFDRQIVVDRPDLAGRRKILEVHAKGKPLAKGADLDVLAKRTPGFTGADLANLLNEAAILTARRNLRQIGMRECEEAIDRVLAGPERKTLVMNEHDKLVTAYHEAGHAIVGHVLPNADPIHKVSIVARSRSLGLTFTLPEDRYNHSRSQLRDAMAMCLGGRTAEEIVFQEPTTGAENDIEKVSQIARAMVTEYGMSDVLGPQQLGQREGEVFLGREIGHQPNYSDVVAAQIDAEVRGLIDDAHDRARAVLTYHRAILDQMARDLVEKETLDHLDLAEILGPLEPWPAPAPAVTSADRPARNRRPLALADDPEAAVDRAASSRRPGQGRATKAGPIAVPPEPAPSRDGRSGRRRPVVAPAAAPVARSTPAVAPVARSTPARRTAALRDVAGPPPGTKRTGRTTAAKSAGAPSVSASPSSSSPSSTSTSGTVKPTAARPAAERKKAPATNRKTAAATKTEDAAVPRRPRALPKPSER